MRVRVHVREQVLTVECGEGQQRIKWLAMTSLHRYETDIGGVQSHKHVATGLSTADGQTLPSNKIINRVLEDMSDVYVRVQEDDKIAAGPKGAHMALGTSAFLVSQGASAAKCTISGGGIMHNISGQRTNLFVIARDTYGNLTRNGGDHFTLRGEGPGVVDATIRDLGDGSYLVSYSCLSPGRYTMHIDLEGLHIDGSPFETIATRPLEIMRLKWNTPALSGQPPLPVACAVSLAVGSNILVIGGTAGGERPTNSLRVLHTDRMKWSDAALADAVSPPPFFAAASAILGTRLLLYGGEEGGGFEPSAAPLSTLWSLDITTREWRPLDAGGMHPGPRSFAAASAVGNTLYLFGGWNGTSVTNELFQLKTNAPVPSWEPADISAASPMPKPRMGHTMVTIGEKLYVYGGRGADVDGMETVLSDLVVFDTSAFGGGGIWSIKVPTGEVPRERWMHACSVFNESLVVFGGYDSVGESNTLALLNTSTLRWEMWEATSARAGPMLHMVEGRVLVLGGIENGLACDDVLQYNLGGFQLEFDGVDDEVMVPHPPSLLPSAYTIEAWIYPAKANVPMNIIARSNESYPTSVWSHQLRLNERGKLQHVTHLESGERMVAESNTLIKAGKWTHVAATAATDGDLGIYIDGWDDDVPQMPLTSPLNTSLDRFFIASKTGDAMGLFQGVITEVRVWNSVRTQETIREDMKKVRARARGGGPESGRGLTRCAHPRVGHRGECSHAARRCDTRATHSCRSTSTAASRGWSATGG